MKTKIVNKTPIDFELHDMNVGIARMIKLLKGVDENGEPGVRGGQYTVTVDVNATFKEYHLIGSVMETKMIYLCIDSDMCHESSVINIILSDITGEYELDCEPRGFKQTGGNFSRDLDFRENSVYFSGM